MSDNRTCSCGTSRACHSIAHIFQEKSSVLCTFESLPFGCSLIETTLVSSLPCFYCTQCIKEYRLKILDHAYFEAEGIHIKASILNSFLTRFCTNVMIETLAYNMFIELWKSHLSYTFFHNPCASVERDYTSRYQSAASELLNTFLSVIFSGLSIALRFIVQLTLFKYLKRFAISVVPDSSIVFSAVSAIEYFHAKKIRPLHTLVSFLVSEFIENAKSAVRSPRNRSFFVRAKCVVGTNPDCPPVVMSMSRIFMTPFTLFYREMCDI